MSDDKIVSLLEEIKAVQTEHLAQAKRAYERQTEALENQKKMARTLRPIITLSIMLVVALSVIWSLILER